LESFHYTVVSKNCGKDAVESFSEDQKGEKSIVAMIFDLTIPGGMGGLMALRKVRSISSEIPVFVVSGYSEDPVMTNPQKYGFTGALNKPFTKAELGKLLQIFSL